MLKVLLARVVVVAVLIVDAEIRHRASRAIARLLDVDALNESARLRLHVNAGSDDIILAVCSLFSQSIIFKTRPCLQRGSSTFWCILWEWLEFLLYF